MPVYRLDDRLAFPDPSQAEDTGLLAIGGDLSPDRLLLAYTLGIFPWYSEGLPILWHSPDPRMAMRPSDLHVPRSLRKKMRRQPFELRFDSAFEEVIAACASVPREDQDGTWIIDEMREAYIRLHELGFAHSAEAWQGGELVGGLYGVSLGGAFFGESMFARVSDASKVAFVDLVEHLKRWDFSLVDCQVYTHHLERFGASEWSRDRFQEVLQQALAARTRRGRWSRELPGSAPPVE